MPFSSAITTGIAQSAAALGISPVDLATVISYETGGTFDPTKRGPTTRWGTHRGFIQFGEPQAAKYGVNWDDPIATQLGPDGAIVRYLRDAGVTPGTSLLDLYSAINAGQVGRHNARDAASGGAPGTVADKVNEQMADHRKQAQAMFKQAQAYSPSTQANDPSLNLPDTKLMPVPDTPALPSPDSDSKPGYDSMVSAYRRNLAAATPTPRKRTAITIDEPSTITF